MRTFVLIALLATISASLAFGEEVETYENGRAWAERIERGACSRLRDMRTDPPDVRQECRRDQAAQPLCMSYRGFAYAWYDLADDPPAHVDQAVFQSNVIDTLGQTATNLGPTPPYYKSPQFRASLHRLLNVALSPSRKKYGSRDGFVDHAYKICIEGHPF